MRAIDTNVLVRLITGDDSAQVAVAEEFVAKGAWVSQLAIAEATWVLSSVYRRKPREIATAIHMLLEHESLTLENPEVISAALAIFQKRPAIGFSDCLLIEMARKAGHLPLGTFDGDLGKISGTEKLRSK